MKYIKNTAKTRMYIDKIDNLLQQWKNICEKKRV